MTGKINSRSVQQRNSLKMRRFHAKNNQPFLLPALSFYVLSVAAALVAFFLTWWILTDSEGEMPWIPAGIILGLILSGAVILREIVFRARRQNLLLAQEQLDFNLKKVIRQKAVSENKNKLTLDRNAAIFEQILQKSEAANVLGKFSDAHWEVFELCDEYLHRINKELETVRSGSPRLAVLQRTREKIQSLHKYHLLIWSASESRVLLNEAKDAAFGGKKVEIGTKALNILETAVQFYPDEDQLVESISAVKEFITTEKVSSYIEKAEKALFKGNKKRALSHYRDALFYLARENIRNSERDLIAEKINQKIEKLL